jgi:hypothetical protein
MKLKKFSEWLKEADQNMYQQYQQLVQGQDWSDEAKANLARSQTQGPQGTSAGMLYRGTTRPMTPQQQQMGQPVKRIRTSPMPGGPPITQAPHYMDKDTRQSEYEDSDNTPSFMKKK